MPLLHLRALPLLLLFAASCARTTPDGGPATSGGEDDGDFADFADFDDMDDMDDEGFSDFADEPTVESHLIPLEELDISGPETPWHEMSFSDQEYYMVGKVLPVMKTLFAGFDAERWKPEEYGCATCHGEDGRERGYHMPATNQIPIPRPGSRGWRAMQREYGAELVGFMQREVTETMATLLGEDEGCWFCHPRAE